MRKSQEEKNELIQDIQSMGRGMSTATILFHQAIAEKAGLSGTDHKYLDLLFQRGSMTAGKMADLSGLTTGAVTGVIDRLEKEGLVKREKDPKDRRKVLIVLEKEKAIQQIGSVFQDMQKGLEILYQNFSLEELMAVKKFIELTTVFFEEQIKKLKAEN